ncbi:MAG: TetR/AcrR family transcriptional regulator [Mogibacterium sp.]|nr:TetR/AcrR family transcriptional regulator [Mogibacterium sp.]
MGRPSMSAEAVKANKINIISTAMEMISESGTASVTARSLGSRTGMNSALIYRYFRDIDEVVLFACVRVLQEYSEDMLEASKSFSPLSDDGDYDDAGIYMLSWEIFCRHAFRDPEEYNTLFFSRHSAELESIIKQYFELFSPEHDNDADIILEAMFRTSNLASRNLILLIPVLEGRRSEQEIILINDMTVAFFYALLVQLVGNDQGVTAETQTRRMLEACRLLAGL